MFKFKISRKSLIITIFLHFFLLTILYTNYSTIYGLFYPILKIAHFPIETWLISIVPTLILVKVFEEELYINLKDMFTNKVKLKTYLLCFLPVFVLIILIVLCNLINGEIRKFLNISEFSNLFLKNFYSDLVHHAIPEEILFGGWILNAFLGHNKTKKHVFLSIFLRSLFYFILRLPTYLFIYNYSIMQILIECVFSFVLNSILAAIFLKSKNIIIPTIVRCLYYSLSYTLLILKYK